MFLNCLVTLFFFKAHKDNFPKNNPTAYNFNRTDMIRFLTSYEIISSVFFKDLQFGNETQR